jgi:hypothetical protein
VTGAELLLIGLRLHLRSFDEDFGGELSMIVPSAAGALDDLLPVTEDLIKEGHSHLRPWVACARQLEAAAQAGEDEVRSFMADTYEKARQLGWTADRDLMDWARERGGFEPEAAPRPGNADAAVEDGWA